MATVVWISLGPVNSSTAFHEGGVGHCNGCHTIHNTQGAISGTGGGVFRWLIPGTDPSSVCLNCHAGPGSPESHHIYSANGTAMSPGGDFYWLKKSFSWAGGSSSGDSHGHNIVAMDFGFRQDPRNSKSPGGNYSSDSLGCNSCHDPHGRTGLRVSGSGSYGPGSPGSALGNYRLLGGIGYGGGSQVKNVSFRNGPPIARQSQASRYGESDISHVDYGSGMSEWCRNCHEAIHKGRSSFEHPAGERLETEMIDTYNRYVKTGDLTGNAATSFLSLVPFERGVADSAALDPSSTYGPDGNARVMCLTCHRAHATAFRAIGRWDFDAQYIVNSHPAPGDGGVTGSDVLYSYYGRNMVGQFGTTQRRFCEKCHKS